MKDIIIISKAYKKEYQACMISTSGMNIFVEDEQDQIEMNKKIYEIINYKKNDKLLISKNKKGKGKGKGDVFCKFKKKII